MGAAVVGTPSCGIALWVGMGVEGKAGWLAWRGAPLCLPHRHQESQGGKEGRPKSDFFSQHQPPLQLPSSQTKADKTRERK